MPVFRPNISFSLPLIFPQMHQIYYIIHILSTKAVDLLTKKPISTSHMTFLTGPNIYSINFGLTFETTLFLPND